MTRDGGRLPPIGSPADHRARGFGHVSKWGAALIAWLALAPWPVVAQEATKAPFGALAAGVTTERSTAETKVKYKLIAQEEARLAGLPFDLVDAVIKVESDYQASRVGLVGEIGLMQIRPATAAMLGFRGTVAELALPATNIHYGATYLGQAWRLTKGDVCRTLMKYRAGHGEEVMSPLSSLYCSRARAHLLVSKSVLAATGQAPALVGAAPLSAAGAPIAALARAGKPPRHGKAFWDAEEVRVRAITARVQSKWRRIAASL